MGRRSDHTRDELHRMALDAARDITEREGLRGLGARRVVRQIGYTIGTLYNLFDDFDDLIIQMNGETLDALYDHCSALPMDKDPKENLRALASVYLEFTRAHPKLWNANFEHRLPDGRQSPDWYNEKALRLRMLTESAIASMFSDGETNLIRHHALVLWTSLHGMASVENADRLPDGETANSLVESLIEIYVGGLAQATDADA
jgi:AcrR family transcriptional regulator